MIAKLILEKFQMDFVAHYLSFRDILESIDWDINMEYEFHKWLLCVIHHLLSSCTRQELYILFSFLHAPHKNNFSSSHEKWYNPLKTNKYTVIHVSSYIHWFRSLIKIVFHHDFFLPGTILKIQFKFLSNRLHLSRMFVIWQCCFR